jgi:hypothetical protein
MYSLLNCIMWQERKEVVTGSWEEDINHIPGVYYIQIVSLMDRHSRGDEDRWHAEQTLARRIMKERTPQKPITFAPQDWSRHTQTLRSRNARTQNHHCCINASCSQLSNGSARCSGIFTQTCMSEMSVSNLRRDIGCDVCIFFSQSLSAYYRTQRKLVHNSTTFI